MTTIEIRTFSTMTDLAGEWNPNACDASDYETPRARALYEALGVDASDMEYALAKSADGLLALICLTCEGHRYAVEVAGPTIDLWEDNSGGLAIVDRASGRGARGFERGQNVARLRAEDREEFTFAVDAPIFDEVVEGEWALYEPMSAEDVEALYEREWATNAAVRVATWRDGEVTVHASSIGAAARWYLNGAK